MMRTLCATAAVLCAACPVLAQSLFLRPVEPAARQGTPDPAAGLYAASLTAIQPPPPRTFAVHDQVTIIINELSRQKTSQNLNTKTESDVDGTLGAIIDPLQLLELRLEAGDTENLTLLKADADREFKGSGSSGRSDTFTDRITATVLDVKPNGLLVLEARRVYTTDRESKVLVVSGTCRQEDVTRQSTVQSTQLADLTIVMHHDGEVAESSRKGWLTKFVEAVFPF